MSKCARESHYHPAPALESSTLGPTGTDGKDGGGGREDAHSRMVASRCFQSLKKTESTAHKLQGTYDKVNGLNLGLDWLFSLRLGAKKPHLDPGSFHLLPTFLPCSVFTGLFMVA